MDHVTDEEVILMAKLAILASKPMGMGFLHHNPDLRIEDIKVEIHEQLSEYATLTVDYYLGRMVKFHARKSGNEWTFPGTLSPEYQSWVYVFPTFESLHAAARSNLS